MKKKAPIPWTIGVDLGGTKIAIAGVDAHGTVLRWDKIPTDVDAGPEEVQREILRLLRRQLRAAPAPPIGIGVGLAGQIDAREGLVRFAPNLGWHNVPIQKNLSRAVGLPVVVTNDVRAATWGEWVHGAGRGCNDLVCLFIGTGVGGGLVSGGRVVSGSTNTAGELGHIIIDLNGPPCTSGHRGCLEALAGGWAIARQAKEAVARHPDRASRLLAMARGEPEALTAKTVVQAFRRGDLLAADILHSVKEALVAGAVSLVHAFNPQRLILGGGVINGFPSLVDQVAVEVRKQSLPAATASLRILRAKLKGRAGVIGAATFALQTLGNKENHDD